MAKTVLEELGEENFRATVTICPDCLALYDGAFPNSACESCRTPLIVRRVKIISD